MQSGSRLFGLALVCVTLFAVFFELGRMDVVTDNEGQRVTPPLELLRTGDWVIPSINEIPYLAKPPLLYWTIAGVYAITGTVSEWTARIPTAACSVALILCVYFLARREAGEQAARWAALALLTTPYLLERSRWAELDAPLTLAVFLSIWWMRAALRTESLEWRPVLAAGVALGAALMLKGPPALLFLLIAWVAWLVVEGTDPGRVLFLGFRWTCVCLAIAWALWPFPTGFPYPLVLFALMWFALAWRYGDRLRRWRSLGILGLVIACGLCLALPWGLAVLHRQGWPFVKSLLHTEALERTHLASRINSGTPFYYFIGLAGMAAPWSFLLPAQFSRNAWREGASLYRFAILCGWLSVSCFSLIAGKEYEYILPAVPFLMLGLGYFLGSMPDTVPDNTDGEIWRVSGYRVWLRIMTPTLVFLALGAALYYVATEKSALLGIEMLGLSLVAVFAYRMNGIPKGRLWMLALVAPLIILTGRGYHYALDQTRSPRTLAAACRAIAEAGYTIETNPRMHSTQPFPYPALAFYLNRAIPLESEPSRIMEKLTGAEPYFFLTQERLLESFPQGQTPEGVSVLLGPFRYKKLVLIGNRPLPDLPAVHRARALSPSEDQH